MTELPNEIICHILDQLSGKDNLLVAQTCRDMADLVLSKLYKDDIIAMQALPVAPYALRWGCWFGALATVEASLNAAAALGLDVPAIIQQVVVKAQFIEPRFKRSVKIAGGQGRGKYSNWNQESRLLHLACLRGNTAVVELLLERGADIDSRDENNYTALHYAPNPGVVRYLLDKGVDVNTPGDWGITALCFLLLWKSSDLETWSVEPNVPGGEGSLEPSHAVQDVRGAIRYLIQEAGADIYVQPPWRGHPLCCAILSENAPGVKLLLEAGASMDPVNPKTGRRTLMLTLAMSNREDPEIVDMLLDAGAQVEVDEDPFQGSYLEIPIMMLLSFAPKNAELQARIAHRICKRMKNVDAMIEGETPLLFYLHARRIDIAKVILQYGADWKTRRHEFAEDTFRELLGSSYEPPEPVVRSEVAS
ncbi:ankyrin repeat-containing domain protein [Dactylonectria macrodidyma]|uniref:Ankyrin repeat-containing domain protein n=1 Tax=Dactylonectria macrodidyma TaxID=307937 RepID=A0A9P9FLT6_9HYPO|nr:ankyrin repeat-containing domain protein [Dactylonectria macrodidyma]